MLSSSLGVLFFFAILLSNYCEGATYFSTQYRVQWCCGGNIIFIFTFLILKGILLWCSAEKFSIQINDASCGREGGKKKLRKPRYFYRDFFSFAQNVGVFVSERLQLIYRGPLSFSVFPADILASYFPITFFPLWLDCFQWCGSNIGSFEVEIIKIIFTGCKPFQ